MKAATERISPIIYLIHIPIWLGFGYVNERIFSLSYAVYLTVVIILSGATFEGLERPMRLAIRKWASSCG